ncbi:MAG: DUF1016 domain-containing protein [Candidatus Omnitrophica bacterium]|nr:DUF1016 domain-containing protein [Candidatus Omnitrophota bacterium]
MKIRQQAVQYEKLLRDIKARILAAQHAALKAVNKELVALYWDIGKMIVERQKDDGWGKAVVVKLADDLQKEFPDTRGFSVSNLWRMRQFFESYRRNEKLATLSRELPWFHNVIILQKTETDEAREFYLKACIHGGWSFRELEHQISVSFFERDILSRKSGQLRRRHGTRGILAHFKDEYILDFLNVKDPRGERELRKAILNKLKDFFLESSPFEVLCGGRTQDRRIQTGICRENAILSFSLG